MRRTILHLARDGAAKKARTGHSGGIPGQRLLLFDVGGETFAIPIEFLREVVPTARDEERQGLSDQDCEVLIHRGSPIPAIDLRALFGSRGGPPAGGSHILVGEGGGRRFGLVVDRVGDVVEASPQAFLQVPEGASALPVACFRGVLVREDRVTIVLDQAGLAALECVERAEADRVALGPGQVEAVP